MFKIFSEISLYFRNKSVNTKFKKKCILYKPGFKKSTNFFDKTQHSFVFYWVLMCFNYI